MPPGGDPVALGFVESFAAVVGLVMLKFHPHYRREDEERDRRGHETPKEM